MSQFKTWIDKKAVPNFYTVLGVQESATIGDIKRAYRKLARENHPDLHPGDQAAEERFKAIGEAYEWLSNDLKRRDYDRFCRWFYSPDRDEILKRQAEAKRRAEEARHRAAEDARRRAEEARRVEEVRRAEAARSAAATARMGRGQPRRPGPGTRPGANERPRQSVGLRSRDTNRGTPTRPSRPYGLSRYLAVMLLAMMALGGVGITLGLSTDLSAAAKTSSATEEAQNRTESSAIRVSGFVKTGENPCLNDSAHWLKLTGPTAHGWASSVSHWTYRYGGEGGMGSRILQYHPDSNTVNVATGGVLKGLVVTSSDGRQSFYTPAQNGPTRAPLSSSGQPLTQLLYCAKS